MAQKIFKLGLKREKNHLYYIGKDGNIWAAPMARAGKKGGKAKKVADARVKKEKGFLYFLDKDGDIAKAKMKKDYKNNNDENDEDADDLKSQDEAKMVFVNMAYMKHYKGITPSDKPKYGGANVVNNIAAGEIYNFKAYKGFMYGGGYRPRDHRKLGALAKGNTIKNVLLIWVSKIPNKNRCIAGWYQNATLFGNYEKCPDSQRMYHSKRVGYFAKAESKNCVLLKPMLRIFPIPKGKGGMGQKNVWYANQDKHMSFKKHVISYVQAVQQNKQISDKYSTPFKIKSHVWQFWK